MTAPTMGLGEVVRLPLRASWRQRCIQCSWEMFMCRWGREGLLSVVGVIRKGGAVHCSTRSGWGSRCRFCVLSVPPAQSRRSFLTAKRKQRGYPLIWNTYLGFTDTNLRLFRQWSNFYCKKGVVSSFLPCAIRVGRCRHGQPARVARDGAIDSAFRLCGSCLPSA